MAEDTVALSEHSVISYEKESTRGSLPSTSSAWQEFGDARDVSFSDLGPRQAVNRETAVGFGQEASEITYEGIAYGGSVGPFRIRDPRILGFALSKEESRADLGGGNYRHVLVPTDKGLLDSMAIAMIDKRLDLSPVRTEGIAYLETVVPRVSLRGEAVNADGSGGHLMGALDVLPHNHTESGLDNISVNVGSKTPYRFSHATIELEGEEVARIESFELTIDRRATHAYFWRSADNEKPSDAVPEGAIYDLNMDARADLAQYGGNNRTLRGFMRQRELFDMEFKFIRTAGEDEFDFQLTDVALEEATGERRRGPISLRPAGPVKSLKMRYVDQLNSAYFST